MLAFHNASGWELPERGLIRTGYAADLVVFDEERIRPRLPTVEQDLPGGARRLVQKADGIRATVVNGSVAFEDGESTGNLAGKVLKGRLASSPPATRPTPSNTVSQSSTSRSCGWTMTV